MADEDAREEPAGVETDQRRSRVRKAHTVHDIARLAGVSTATVNRVVQARGYVAEATRTRVEEAIRSTAYRPSVLAQGLRRQRSYTIGHVLTAITSNPFFVQVARSVEEAALAAGYKTFLFNHNSDADRERLGVGQFIERRVDAIIFSDAYAGANVQAALDAGIPVVQVERATGVATSSVLVDNRVGASEAMSHLLALGHRRIAFIGGDPGLHFGGEVDCPSIETDRLASYQACLEAACLPVDPALVRLGPYYDGDGTGGCGYRHAAGVLALADPPTAIFATCDILAAGVLQAVYDLGLRVPDDISVVGFDDTLAANLTPPLTTVAQPMREIGRRAFELSLEAIEDHRPPRSVTVSTHLNIRRSTGPAP